MILHFDKTIGQKIRQLRHLKGFTQQELARRLGISFQQIQKYERGANKLSFERACQMSEIFGVPLASWLHTEEIIIPSEQNDRQALNLLQAFHAIQDSERRSLLCALALALGKPQPHSESLGRTPIDS